MKNFLGRFNQAYCDVAYNVTSDLWACCGSLSDGSISCPDPSDETFEASPPEALLSLANAILTASQTSSSSLSLSSSYSAITTLHLTSSSLATNKAYSSHGTDAMNGIVVGAAFGAVTILALLVWAIVRARKLRKVEHLKSSTV